MWMMMISSCQELPTSSGGGCCCGSLELPPPDIIPVIADPATDPIATPPAVAAIWKFLNQNISFLTSKMYAKIYVILNSGSEIKKINSKKVFFTKFYGKVGVISWLLFLLIWKNYVLNWDFDSKSWIVDFFHSFHSWKNTTKQLFLSKFQCRK